MGISLVVGVVDLIISLVKQKNQKKIQQRLMEESNNITIIPTVEYIPGGQPPSDTEQENKTEEE